MFIRTRPGHHFVAHLGNPTRRDAPNPAAQGGSSSGASRGDGKDGSSGPGRDPSDGEELFTDEEIARMLRGLGPSLSGGGDAEGAGSAASTSNSLAWGQVDADRGSKGSGADGNSEVQDTLADILEMEVRRSRVREDVAADLEARKERLRGIGEEMASELAREYDLDRLRTEMNASYAMSETLSALDDVEAEVARIKAQVQADKADLAAWEARTAEERSRGLFFKNLYKPDIPNQESAAGQPSAPAPESSSVSPSAGSAGSTWDAEAAAAAASRPLSAASRTVRSPLRLYLFTYLSAFLALLVVNDVASTSSAGAQPHVAQDALYGVLSTGLAVVAVGERSALGAAQDAMLEGIRRRAGGGRDKSR